MDAKHTKGPWYASRLSEGVWIIKNEAFDSYIALTHNREGVHADANASLIAAAPDLLEALQDALRSVAADVEHYEDQVHHGTYAEAQDDLDEAQELYAKMRAAIAKAEGK